MTRIKVNAKLLPPLMLSGVVVLLYGVVGGRVAVPRLRLSSEPMFVKDGKPVTISCRGTRGNNITTARWYRDNVEIFQTSYLHPIQALDVNRTASVYGRVAVNATIRHHDVILQFNSTLDDRSVWWCKNGNESSYKMTLCSEHIDECIRPNLTMEPQKAADGNTITLSCRHGGGRNLTTVLWYRNYVYIFQTSAGYPEALQDEQSDREDYKAVEERISVKANSTVHNVILRMNSALDAESVWTCENNQKFSSDLVIDTNQTEESTPLPLQSTTTGENDTSRKTTTVLKTTMATTEEYDTSRKTITAMKRTMATTEEYVCTAEGTTSATTLTTSQSKDLTSTQQPTMQTTTPVSSTNNASTYGGDTDSTSIVVGVVGGAVLLAVVVVSIVCMRRRRQAARHQNDGKEESNVEATPVYQNTASFHTVSDSSAPVTKPEKTQQDDPVMPEDVNSQNMYESLTSVEMHIYRGLK